MVRSPAKTTANRAKAAAFWNAVRAGEKPAPRRLRTPPAPEAVANLLADYCRQAGITRLEAFGSTARGDAKRGSDVDLLATFAGNQAFASSRWRRKWRRSSACQCTY